MELLIENIKSRQDRKMLVNLVKRLGFSSRDLSEEEKEDFALGKAIEQRTGDYVDYKDVMQLLNQKIKIRLDKLFYKDLSKIPEKSVAIEFKSIILEIENVSKLSEIWNLKKLKGYEIGVTQDF